MGLKDWLRRILRRRAAAEVSAETLEGLRTRFRAQYHRFKLLLTANNRALDIMTEIEEALSGERPLGMGFVRSRCTRVAASVFQTIRHLDEIVPEKYEALYQRFKHIQKQINPFLAKSVHRPDTPFILPLETLDVSHVEQTGNKMAYLGELGNRMGLRTPKGFVITAEAYRRFMQHNQLQTEIEELIQSAETDRLDEMHGLSEGIQQFIIGSQLPPELEEAIVWHYATLEEREGEGVPVVMRSSALGEDAPGMSFAGQYLTEFNVTGETIFHAYKKVVASKYRVQAMIYRLNRGVADDDVAMCVGCMPQIRAAAGGVAYSRNPLDPEDDSVMIHSVSGLPRSVVDGTGVSDIFVVGRGDPMRVVRKEIKSPERAPSLTDEKALELARAVLEVEQHHGSPRDIEWVVEPDGTLCFVQDRPLAQAEKRHGGLVEGASESDEWSVLLSGGVTASRGAGAGPVCVVRKESDVNTVPTGAVLVAAQALPYWASVLNRVAAVVTERGSIAVHLANVAREFNVPALFGIEGALERLDEGRTVTVDADGLRVLDGRVEALLDRPRAPTVHLEGSPVFRALKGVAENIVPLRLLDPESTDFKPEKCATFHDITRFCHEKAVREMFRFGTEHEFPRHSSRQLKANVPMQFWIVDLDDGMKEDLEESGYVRLDEIVSVPMLSLWRGMNAIPWAGPPPVNPKGFLSILAESTADPALVPSIPSAYSARNYFMISKHFLSLQSRFGYHFSGVEALVGDRAQENYISFQFKGGAAARELKVRRARMVAEILEVYGFRTDLHGDSVAARLENYEQPHMQSRLAVIGYLVIHTRQLDMDLTSESAVKRHRTKILEELKTVESDRPA